MATYEITDEDYASTPMKENETMKEYHQRIRAKASRTKYMKNSYKQVCWKLHVKNDSDILEHLEGINESISSYIKSLIREDMERN